MTDDFDGEIPVNAGDLPIDAPEMDDAGVYTGELKKFTVSPKLDKNDKVYGSLQVEVTQGDFEGYTVMMNYLPLPIRVGENASKGQQVRATLNNVAFGRFVRGFGIKGEIPSVKSVNGQPSREGVQAFTEFMDMFIGNTGKFTIQNQEFPAGSGRMRPGVKDFVF